MRHGSLFSGIGGFDLAAQWMGWTNVFHTEWNEFGQKVLKHHFPNSISYHDIIKTDYTIHNGDIDIITGGFPCQPFSLAGKRKGTDDERYLWHEMLRAIQQIRPTYVVAENVRGLLTIDGGMVFEQVCADLEAEGYEVQPVLLPAAGVNAPHRRDRIFIVGYAANTKPAANAKNIGLAQSTQIGCEREEFKPYNRNDIWNSPDSDGTGRSTSNTDDNGNSSQGQSSEVERDRCRNNGIKEQRQQSTEWTDGLHGFQSDAANANVIRLEGCLSTGINAKPIRESKSRRKISKHLFKNREGIQFENFPTQSPICGGDDGIPDRLDNITFPKWRNESIKAYGNAVVPQLILPIFQTIEKLHREKK
jgi:DNA (cytosine-5)-methyltransferase 1